MGKRVLLIMTALSLLLTAAGCASVFAADYSYVTQYSDETDSADAAGGAEIKNYTQLKKAISDMVDGGLPGGELSFSGYTGSPERDMAEARYEIKSQTPMGAWAVEELSYELNRIVSYYVAEVTISYRRTAVEMADVVQIKGVSSLKDCITEAVEQHKSHLVLRMVSSTVNEEYIQDLVSGAYLNDPLVSAGEPFAAVTGYPSEGVNRIYEIELSYGMAEPELSQLRERLENRASAVCQSVTARESWRRALELAQTLAGGFRAAEPSEGTADTVSGALTDGRASSMGAALAYKVLCDELGIECVVVRGLLGTLGAENHYWNIIGIDGDYYHVDVSRFVSEGAEKAFLLDDARAWGTYMWDVDKYPVCSGDLDYAELSAPPAGETEETPEPSTEPSAEPEESPEPTETVSPEPSESVEPTPGAEPEESPEPTETAGTEPVDGVTDLEPTEPVKSPASAKPRAGV